MDSDAGTVEPIAVDVPSEPARQAVLPEEPARRRRTQHRVPAKFRDLAPEPLPRVETVAARVQRVVEQVVERVFEPVKTVANAFGLFRVFRTEPVHDPVHAGPAPPPAPIQPSARSAPSWHPYPNRSTALFNHWFWNDGTTKTCDSRSSLLDVLLQPGFVLDDLRDINWSNLDDALASDLGSFGDGWLSESIRIDVPGGRGIEARPVDIPGFQRRPLIPLLEHILATDPTVETHWNWTPSALMHQDNAGNASRTAGEVFHSPRAERLYNQVQRLPREPEDTLERRVIYLMPGSDATHLAQFGTASAWPGLMGIGNQSNYVRTRRDAHAMHHFASFPKIPDAVHDEIKAMNVKKSVKKKILTQIRRDLMHGCWKQILDKDFCRAYKEGFVVTCQDGVARRFFPRFYTYTADYPEKMLMATLRDNGALPCPRCHVKKTNIHQLGTPEDRNTRTIDARKHDGFWRSTVSKVRGWILKGTCALAGKIVEMRLQEWSWVPTENAFNALKDLDPSFSIFCLFAPDLLHEFELGVWKSLLIHLLRILYAVDPHLLEELDSRFRQIPIFGRFSIRRFSNNVSELKQLAAHNFEDILQCSIPAFENLLPEPFNTTVMNILYTFAEWHALAKLRLQTEDTLKSLEETTITLGAQMRSFSSELCPEFRTVELPREQRARARREARANTAADTSGSSAPVEKAPKEKGLNINTVKLHSLGDYTPFIRECGSSDAYSSLLVENAHPQLKQLYHRSNKRNAGKQISRMERIQAANREIFLAMEPARCAPVLRGVDEGAALLPASAKRADVSARQREYIDIADWVDDQAGHPRAKDFSNRLRDHLLNRLQKRDYDGDEAAHTTAERLTVNIIQNRMYSHKTASIHYTTYDVRHGEDTIHVGNDRVDIMLRALEDDSDGHPYWYARVLGIYHVNVLYTVPGTVGARKPRLMRFLHIRWFGRDMESPSTADRPRLTRLGWDTANEYGFVDPELVLRACHIVPAFAHGKEGERFMGVGEADWRWYYVMRWSDRDLFMRMRGGGIGHATARVAEEPQAQRTPAGEPERRSGDDATMLEEDETQGAETEEQVHEHDEPAPDEDEDEDDEGEDEGSEEEGEEEEDDLLCDSGEEDGQDNVDDLAMEDDDSDLDYCD
ncbi:hypothetical protein EXIGLDRAFT_751594 [Exidia glandulosa HHB12029]|uniref:Uncharacterized protein n=1 Tax=Exidia glandulosa HHB12029 TaxID=1314781 RepID=A0A165F9G7_EXIGL|nr:hypothetical protein EXIGLDRAFT_751594 [Exidia glandulosa HHB12029]